ncbi:hypothetical protein MP477_08870 [Chryseobacterium sp. WG23]|uniref:hypothetical protein n=1 Tax=Chryseobacterium sp. WG23 TaxID=2926910 RepID=UPI00211EC943|nr:hypothetical protein [Chryseobacterium sp. WG23]MCQ9635063.1 hypothetical protein [Chryseobacterium sp. WG23]
MNYEFFYKKKYEIISDKIDNDHLLTNYDILISAYNSSTRVNFVMENITALEKHIFILSEYNFSQDEVDHLNGKYQIFDIKETDEADVLGQYFLEFILPNKGKKIIFDLTGFLRPHIVYFLRLCKQFDVLKIDFLYSEPNNYKKKENTQFSMDFQYVRDIKGCSGSHNHDTSNDFLIIGSGYDYSLVMNIAKEKKQTKKVQILGFPSLQADMFQQNILKAYQTEEEIYPSIELDSKEIILAPANDPFITASLLSKFIKKSNSDNLITNLYLCPLSTKAQTLGIALFFVSECINSNVSVIFPFCNGYEKETSEGISRFWIYSVEL